MKSNAGFVRWMRAVLLALPALFFLAGCGGSGTIVAGGGTGGTGISAGVIAGFGSVIVNGVEFTVIPGTTESPGTKIRLNDIDVSESDLRIGMTVKLRGTFRADGVTGIADSIEANSSIQGRISLLAPGTDSFSVLGQKSFVDSQTVFSGADGLSDLPMGAIVRVFGFRDAFGDIRATLVERVAGPGEDGEEEVLGIVSEKGLTTFQLGSLVVDYVTRNPEIDPPGFDNGDPVEVEGEFNVARDLFEATKIEREDIEDAQFVPMEGEKVEVEGFASEVTEDPPGIFTFLVGGFPVRTDAETSYKGGDPSGLVVNVKVETKGRIDANGILVAEKIEFE